MIHKPQAHLDTLPLVSIGLPVYNGQNFLSEAIESIRRQTYQNIELIISDNASEDLTQKICERHAAEDPRIKYHRQAENIGAAPNFNYLVEVSNGKYFKWAAHDDLLAESYIEKCVDVLESDDDVVLCSSHVTVIDTDGRACDAYEGVEPQFFANSRASRFGHIIQFHKQRCYEIFGVIRVSSLRDTGLIGGYKNGDGVLLARLALRGKFALVPEKLFFPRRHPSQSQRIVHDSQAYNEWFDPANKEKISLTYWRILQEFSRAIDAENLPTFERIRCRAKLARQWLVSWRLIRGDLRRAVPRLISKYRTRYVG